MHGIPGTSSGPEHCLTGHVRLEELFDSCRFQERDKIFRVILYFPLGLFLLLVRLLAGILGLVILSLLPRTSYIRSTIFKAICKILGVAVDVDDKYLDDNVKLLVANHVSILDRVAVNFVLPCNTIVKGFSAKDMCPESFWKDADIRYSRELTNEDILALKLCIEGSPLRGLNFPEGATTNGKVGFLKFHPDFFSLGLPVQPVIIHVTMSTFINVSPSVLGSSIWFDVLLPFFLPCTIFSIKVLPSMVKLPEETPFDFSRRVQMAMASTIGLTPTIYTSTDKVELKKRIRTSVPVIAPSSSTLKTNVQPREQYSSVPSKSRHHPSKKFQAKLSLNTAAKTFGKSSKERMMSYQQRKAVLVEAAKLKYFEKHGIE